MAIPIYTRCPGPWYRHLSYIAKLSCKPGIITKYLEKYEIKLFQNMHTYVCKSRLNAKIGQSTKFIPTHNFHDAKVSCIFIFCPYVLFFTQVHTYISIAKYNLILFNVAFFFNQRFPSMYLSYIIYTLQMFSPWIFTGIPCDSLATL